MHTVRGAGWEYTRWRAPGLDGLVDHLWAFAGPTVNPRKRVFPNGCIELIVNLAQPYRLLEGGGPALLRHVFVGGMQTGPMLLEQPAHQACVAARLTVRGARLLFGRPLSEVTDLHVDLDDLLGAAARELAERCAEAATAPARLQLLAAWLRARMRGDRAGRDDPAISWAVARLERSAGTTAIAALQRDTQRGKAALAAAFRDHVGVTPKVFARILRLRRVLGLLQGDRGGLAEVALAAGFYDQAHMNAEFRALAGMTPRQFLAARHPVGDGSTAAG
ncbi:MAG: helix-turn-helix transcriptional regulator [Deltaproteobacteria bacterium]|nr:helix-turn-helix transcriptional regulator [Deltaproteobacteria bacterium]